MAEDEVESVAKALYSMQECARGWPREPEGVKERFRNAARAAIAAFDGHSEIVTSPNIAPLVMTGDIHRNCEFLMNSLEVSVLTVPSSRACRTVLQGPDLRIEAYSEPFAQHVGRRGFEGLPVREAFPELKGQGYFELQQQVYQTSKAFVGHMMPILFQERKGAPLEEHITDFVYRPIEDTAGQITGIFVEGHDRTEWARA